MACREGEGLTWKKEMKMVRRRSVTFVSRNIPLTSSNSFSVNPVNPHHVTSIDHTPGHTHLVS